MPAPVDLAFEAPLRSVGGFSVRRALPNRRRRMVGPFIFLDQLGPVTVEPGQGFDVRPHPHIGLATVTWLFEGRIVHRDSLGCVQAIEPGAVNWMSAGRGIVHSERSSPEDRAAGTTMSGIQSWVALPVEQEEHEPWFRHYPAATLPTVERDGLRLTLVAGAALGARSPVQIASALFYVDAPMGSGATLELPREYTETAAYVAQGAVEVDGTTYGQGTLIVFGDGEPRLRAVEPSRVMLLGGEPFPEPRHIDWNFVASTRERIDVAKRAWVEDLFPRIPGETERVPLPDLLGPGTSREPQPM